MLGPLRRKLGAEPLWIDALDVRGLLEALVERGGDELADVFFAEAAGDAPGSHQDLRVLVNGRSVTFLQGLATLLKDEDRVTVHLSGARGFPGG